jgi:post-segregation antitoxin (ccd killing protein)
MDTAPKPDPALSWEDESLPSEVRRKLWQEENKEAIEAWNRWDEEHGSPLDRYRAF